MFDQKVETWLRLHTEAFAVLGGVPRTVVPANLKAAVVQAAFGVDDQSTLNRSDRELARHHRFKIDPTPIARTRRGQGGIRVGLSSQYFNIFDVFVEPFESRWAV